MSRIENMPDMVDSEEKDEDHASIYLHVTKNSETKENVKIKVEINFGPSPGD